MSPQCLKLRSSVVAIVVIAVAICVVAIAVAILFFTNFAMDCDLGR